MTKDRVLTVTELVQAYNDRLNSGDDPKAPTGDDYNALLALIGGESARVSANLQVLVEAAGYFASTIGSEHVMQLGQGGELVRTCCGADYFCWPHRGPNKHEHDCPAVRLTAALAPFTETLPTP